MILCHPDNVLAVRNQVSPGNEESASHTENDQDLGDRWEYRRIVARRIEPNGSPQVEEHVGA